MKVKVKRRALKRLVKLLRKDADNPEGIQFDMGTWGRIEDKKNVLSCGTTACGMGLAALSGKFSFEAILRKVWNDDTQSYEPYRILAMRRVGERKETDPITLAEETFGLGSTLAMEMFIPSPGFPSDGRAGELSLANRIEKFIETGWFPTIEYVNGIGNEVRKVYINNEGKTVRRIPR